MAKACKTDAPVRPWLRHHVFTSALKESRLIPCKFASAAFPAAFSSSSTSLQQSVGRSMGGGGSFSLGLKSVRRWWATRVRSNCAWH